MQKCYLNPFGKMQKAASNNLFQLKLNADLFQGPISTLTFSKNSWTLFFIPEVKASKPHLGPEAETHSVLVEETAFE